MYVQGVSTRKVTKVMEQLCGLEVTSTQVNEADRRLRELIETYHDTAPRLADWLEANVPEGLTTFALPAGHRKRLRTTNSLERLNKQIKRRTRVATLFANEASLLRLACPVLSEISDEWESSRAYLNMEAR